jgi:hypothetical protein
MKPTATSKKVLCFGGFLLVNGASMTLERTGVVTKTMDPVIPPSIGAQTKDLDRCAGSRLYDKGGRSGGTEEEFR